MRVHKDYGLNQTIPTCFFCGEAKNEVVLLGAAFKGEAPLQMVIDAEPCEACREKFALGITLFGVEVHEPGRTVQLAAPMNASGLTGSFVVVSDDFFERVLAARMAHAEVDGVRRRRWAYAPDADVRRLIAMTTEAVCG